MMEQPGPGRASSKSNVRYGGTCVRQGLHDAAREGGRNARKRRGVHRPCHDSSINDKTSERPGNGETRETKRQNFYGPCKCKSPLSARCYVNTVGGTPSFKN